MSATKLTLASWLDRSGLNAALARVYQRSLGPHLRAVNYHDVPPSRADAFREQVRFYAENYRPIGRTEFDAFRAGKGAPDDDPRPGLLVSFDDGLRSHAEVAAPVLEEFGFPGWFMVPSGFVDTPVAEQRAFAETHQIVSAEEYDDERVAMTWEQIRALEARHVIGCHSVNHRRLEAKLSAAEREHEIVDSKRRFESQLGHELDVFCWVGGEEWSYSREAAALIRSAGYRLSFMTNNAPILRDTDPLQLQRSNIEAFMPLPLVRFNLAGWMDLLYAGKRRRVNRLTAG